MTLTNDHIDLNNKTDSDDAGTNSAQISLVPQSIEQINESRESDNAISISAHIKTVPSVMSKKTDVKDSCTNNAQISLVPQSIEQIIGSRESDNAISISAHIETAPSVNSMETDDDETGTNSAQISLEPQLIEQIIESRESDNAIFISAHIETAPSVNSMETDNDNTGTNSAQISFEPQSIEQINESRESDNNIPISAYIKTAPSVNSMKTDDVDTGTNSAQISLVPQSVKQVNESRESEKANPISAHIKTAPSVNSKKTDDEDPGTSSTPISIVPQSTEQINKSRESDNTVPIGAHNETAPSVISTKTDEDTGTNSAQISIVPQSIEQINKSRERDNAIPISTHNKTAASVNVEDFESQMRMGKQMETSIPSDKANSSVQITVAPYEKNNEEACDNVDSNSSKTIIVPSENVNNGQVTKTCDNAATNIQVTVLPLVEIQSENQNIESSAEKTIMPSENVHVQAMETCDKADTKTAQKTVAPSEIQCPTNKLPDNKQFNNSLGDNTKIVIESTEKLQEINEQAENKECDNINTSTSIVPSEIIGETKMETNQIANISLIQSCKDSDNESDIFINNKDTPMPKISSRGKKSPKYISGFAMMWCCKNFNLNFEDGIEHNKMIISQRRSKCYKGTFQNKSFKEKVCQVIHIPELPTVFGCNHIKSLILLHSKFNVESKFYIVDVFHENPAYKTCLIRFANTYDCQQVYLDLQGIILNQRPLLVKLDVGHNLMKRRYKYSPRSQHHFRKILECYYRELKQNNTAKDNTNSDVTIINDQTEEPMNVTSTVITKMVHQQKSTSDVAQTAKETKKDENVNEQKPSNDITVTKKDDSVNIDACKGEESDTIVHLTNMPHVSGQVMSQLIRTRVSKDIRYFLRRIVSDDINDSHEYLLKFSTHEEALMACNKLNKIMTGGRVIEAKLVKARFFEEITSKNKGVFSLKRKLEPEDYYSEDQVEAKRGRLENFKYADLAVSYAAPEPQSKHSYGLNVQYLKKLGITLPLTNRIVVTNLHGEIDADKLLEVFSLAGEVKNVDFIYSNKKAFIEFDHPVEAVQAISLFNKQKLYGNAMHINMDRLEERLLPIGLASIGRGFGENGVPLRAVRTKVEEQRVNELFVDIGKLRRIHVSNPNHPFQFRYEKRDGHVLPSRQRNNESNPLVSSSSNHENRQNTDDMLKAFRATLVAKGLIPANTDCDNFQSILKALQSSTQGNEDANKRMNPDQPQYIGHVNSSFINRQMQNQSHNTPKLPAQQQPNMAADYSSNQQIINQLMLYMSSNAMNPNIAQNMMQSNVGQNMMQPNMAQNMMQPNMAQNMMQPNMAQNMMQPNMAQNMIQPVPNVAPYVNAPALMYGGQSQTQSRWDVTASMVQNSINTNIPTPKPVQNIPPPLSARLNAPPPLAQSAPLTPARPSFPPPNVAPHMVQSPVPPPAPSISPAHEQVNRTPSPIEVPPVSKRQKVKFGMSHVQPTQPSTVRPSHDDHHHHSRSDKSTTSTSKSKKGDMLLFKNLPPSVTGGVLSSKMSEVGELALCTVIGEGEAVVRFKHAEDSQRCIRLFKGSKVDGQVIDVNVV